MEPMFWDFERYLIGRYGAKIRRGKIFQTEVWSCKGGQVMWRLLTGVFGRRVQSLVDWMDEEGMADALKDVEDWESLDFSSITQEKMEAWEEAIGKFFMQHSMTELHEEAQKRFVFLAPCYTPEEIAGDKQLASRDFWVELEHPELDTTLRYLGAPCKLSLTPWRIYRRAPRIGEHNKEVYQGEFGFTNKDLIILKQAGII